MSTGLLAWHYTTFPNYQKILESGCLRPTDAHLAEGEKAILWLSTNPYWEETANKAWQNPDGTILRLSMKETAEKAGGLVRFALPLEMLVRWPRIGQQANMKSKIRKALEEEGIRQHADYREWYGTVETIKLTDCIAIETMNMETWIWESMED